jgi:hypothetical protein
LVDVESGEHLDVSNLESLLDLYQATRLDLEERARQAFVRRGGKFLSLDSTETPENVLLQILRREGWLG